MDDTLPNPEVAFSRDGTEHRCAELFARADNRTACRNCRTLMHYVLGPPVGFRIDDAVFRAAAACRPGDPAAVYDAVRPLTPCLRPAAVPAGLRS